MKSPRDILLGRHQSATPELDAIRKGVIAKLPQASAREPRSLRELWLSLRWHLTAMSAAWIVAMILNFDPSSGGQAPGPGKSSDARQIWASFRESRRLLLQYTETPAAETPEPPLGRRTEIQPQQAEV